VSIPWATLGLLFANLCVAFFSLGNQDFGLRWGFIPEPLSHPPILERLITAATSLFVHVDPVHLMANMVVLAGAGPVIERAVGPIRLLAVCVVSGLLGVAAHTLISLAAMPAIAGDPLYGASGVAAGLIGYVWARHYRARIPITPRLYVPVWSIVLVWVALQVVGGILALRQFGSPTAYWAHLGGFVVGLLFALVFGAPASAREEAWSSHLDSAQASGAGAAAVASAKRITEKSDDIGALKMRLESCDKLGDASGAEEALRGLMRAEPDFAITELSRRGLLRKVPVSERAKIAQQLFSASPAAAETALQSILEEPANSETPNALLMLIDLFGPAQGGVYAARLRKEYALSPQAETARAKWPELFAD
jgi:membrane associated rhomboid family serine protease